MSEEYQFENTLDLVLVLLYAKGVSGKKCEPIEGITRLQKFVFLLNQGRGAVELVEIAKEYEYQPYKMGPYSNELRDDLETLISLGLVKTEKLTYWIPDDLDDEEDAIKNMKAGIDSEYKKIESYKYYLSNNGEKEGEGLWNSLTSKTRKALIEFKTFFNSLTLRQLLIFVYDQFPTYTGKSEIRQKLGF